MLKAMEIIPEGVYWSGPTGQPRTYNFEVPFGATSKVLTADLKLSDLDDSGNGTKVTLSVVQALTRDIADSDWPLVGDVSLIVANLPGYTVKSTSDHYGPIVRLHLTIEENTVTPTAQKSAQLSARASGKPF